MFIGARTPPPVIPTAQTLLFDGTISNTQWTPDSLLVTDSSKILKSSRVGENLILQNNTIDISPTGTYQTVGLASGILKKYYQTSSHPTEVYVTTDTRLRQTINLRWTVINDFMITMEIPPVLFNLTGTAALGSVLTFPCPYVPYIEGARDIIFNVPVRHGSFGNRHGMLQITGAGMCNVYLQTNFLKFQPIPNCGWDKTLYITFANDSGFFV
jgi:hypothetical protein